VPGWRGSAIFVVAMRAPVHGSWRGPWNLRKAMEGIQYPMQDMVFIIVTVLFFGACIAYAKWCDRLK
jgi:hypothetical protein